MYDLTEVNYWIAEIENMLPRLEVPLQNAKARVDKCKRELAEAQVNYADIRDRVAKLKTSLKDLKEIQPHLLNEPESVQELKNAQRYFDKSNSHYVVPSLGQYIQLQKALFTISAVYEPIGKNEIDGYEIVVDKIPEAYLEFITGEVELEKEG